MRTTMACTIVPPGPASYRGRYLLRPASAAAPARPPLREPRHRESGLPIWSWPPLLALPRLTRSGGGHPFFPAELNRSGPAYV